MATVTVTVLEPATSFNLMTADEARMKLKLDEEDDPTASDEYLNNWIEIYSDMISTLCRRVFARERVRETWRCLGEPCDCPDGATSRNIFLTHWPVYGGDIESVEAPSGTRLTAGGYELDSRAGRLTLYASVAEPIVITYAGGYELPEGAPPALRYALIMAIAEARTLAQRNLAGVLGGAISSIGHKESRISLAQSKEGTTTGGIGKPGSGLGILSSINDLLIHYQRLWM